VKTIYKTILDKKKNNQKQFALLIDPDKIEVPALKNLLDISQKSGVDYFFVGGSFLTNDNFTGCIKFIKDYSSIPVVIFPGSCFQLSEDADAILFLSLISGRNPDMLIGNHVIAAPYLNKSSIEIIPTGYMLVESGKITTVSYMSNSIPIPHDKNDIAVYTALAGQMLGLKLIYMDAGSGAINPVSDSMIKAVKNEISVPLIIGGGIRNPQQAVKSCKAGADIIVIGNAFEKEPKLIPSVASSLHSL
jgi:phosphoglycerol geranylgeranyltransferase